jgi:hypothetical protein
MAEKGTRQQFSPDVPAFVARRSSAAVGVPICIRVNTNTALDGADPSHALQKNTDHQFFLTIWHSAPGLNIPVRTVFAEFQLKPHRTLS